MSLLPSSLFTQLRTLLLHLSSASKSLHVSECRGELGALLKLYGRDARLFALQVAAHTIISRGDEQSAAGAGSSQAGSPTPSALGSKALEAWMSEEVCELQKRERDSWPMLLAHVIEAAASSSGGNGKQQQAAEENILTRFGAVANLSLRHLLSLAVQLHRSPLARLQTAGVHFVAQQLSPSLLNTITPDNKNWSNMPEELLSELCFLVTSPAFPLASGSGYAPMEQKQQILQTLAKLQPQQSDQRAAKQREEAADLASGISAHANATSHVADVLQDLGYSISSSIDSLKDTLHPFPKLSEYDVAR